MDNEQCNDSRKWHWFFLADVVVYFGGLFLIILWKIFNRHFCLRKPRGFTTRNIDISFQSQLSSENVADDYTCVAGLRYYANQVVSTQFLTGRIVALVASVAALLSTVLYLFEMFSSSLSLERCFPLRNPIFCTDLGCNILFFVYFLLRFSITNEKIKFWIGLFTIVDLFTIPQILTSVFLNREWIGLRFLRVLALMRVPEVMQCFNLIKSGTSIRVMQLIFIFIGVVIVGAGFFHLLENTGRLTALTFTNDTKGIGYGDSLYFVIVTLSTVGYGDICAITTGGKIFVTLFILIVLAAVASFIPELAEFLLARSQYLGAYIKESGKKHIIVCGNINYESVSTFLVDFLHEDRSTSDIDVIFINKKEPDVEMKGLLKIFFTQVKYFQGTVMNQMDLDRVQMSTADACLILADQNCSDPNDEDAGNIMRAISFKNYCYRCPVIIQLLQFENKSYLQNIPTWSKRNGDQIICYSEIELGILAQSCLVPGFSTLLTNIFSVRSEKECKRLNSNESWLNDYMRGVTMEIYSARFSRSFDNFSYKDLVEFCFKNLNLLLIAIEIPDSINKRKYLLINPLNCKKIPHGSVGFFICDSYREAANASLYCSMCHATLRDLTVLKRCNCKGQREDKQLTIISRIKPDEEVSLNKYNIEDEFNEIEFMDEKSASIIKKGNFYVCSSQKIQKCIISSEHQTENLRGHIILCIFSDKMPSLIGLKNFLMPLRSTSIPENELKDLIIIAEKEFIEKEWSEICFFPKIKVVFHQISIRRIINLISIDTCSRCVILNSKTNIADLQNDSYMVDKEIIIANLFFQAESKRRMLSRSLKIDSLKRNRSIPTEDIQGSTQKKSISLDLEKFDTKITDSSVPIISKLAIESNVQYLDVKEDNFINIPNYLRKPFAFGCAFTTSMLDSIMSTAYYNPNAINIMEMLINGGSIDDIDMDEIESNNNNNNNLERMTNQFRISLMPVSKINQTVNWTNSVFYRDIFLELLQLNRSVSLGLYRKRILSNKHVDNENVDRYVITNPQANFLIDTSDLVYCLQQKCSKCFKKTDCFPNFETDQKC